MTATLPASETFFAERTTIPILDHLTMTAACDQVLAESLARFSRIEAIPLDEVSVENVLDAWDAESVRLEDAIGPIALLNSVHPDQRVRDAGDACLLKYSSFSTELFQNRNLYERVKAVEPVTNAQRQMRKDLLEAFEDNGVGLDPDRRRRIKEISDRLTELDQEFEKNIRENTTKLTFTPEECQGLPQSYLDRVARDDNGNIVVGFDYPDYDPFMTNASNEEARRRYQIAYWNRGTPRNVAVLEEIVKLRRELASIYGLPSYAHYVTKRRMVENPETVLRFLDEVKSVVSAAEERDLEQLRSLKAEMTGSSFEATRINRWDLPFYRERLRERRFDIDQEALRRFFPTRPVLDWLLLVTGQLYGVSFAKVTVPVWAEDVLYYDVLDTDSGAFIGGIYLDLYPREGKYKHAAAWPVRGVSTRIGRKPISVLVTNFNRDGLTHDELVTFFHEFGHVMHGVLSTTEYNQHAGTSVQRDFVEAPSQMYQEWALRYESLVTLEQACSDCPKIDSALVERLRAARNFGRGIDYARQHLYAAFDMALSSENPRDPMEVWREMEGSTPLGHVEGTSFPGTFAHISGGYAAGYYGYMWSEVLALDMLSAFGENVMNPAVGRRFRQQILSRGGEEPAKTIVERFLGRLVNSDAFYAEISGKRLAAKPA